MAGDTPQEAVENYLAPLQDAVSCITTASLVVCGTDPAPVEHQLVFEALGRQPIGGQHDLALQVLQYFQVVETEDEGRGPWKVNTTAYIYEFRTPVERLLAYHWHPRSNQRPHMHTRAHREPIDLRDAHMPTGRVSVEAMVRLAIEDFGVPALRQDFEEVLGEREAAFQQWRTWA